MSLRQDVIELLVNIKGDKAQNQLQELRKKAIDISAEMKGLKKGTQEYIDANNSLTAVNKKYDEVKQGMGLAALSAKELKSELKKLGAMHSSAVPMSKEYFELDKQMKQVKDRLFEVNNGVTGLSKVFLKFKNEIKSVGTLAVGYLGFQFLSSQFKSIIQGSGKMSDQLSDLRRVAGLTAEEADKLNASLKNIDTRTANGGLRDIAVIAGKLGVAKDDILSFTKAVDQLVVALGDELGDADQITTQLGKILNVFDGKITGDNITKLGNAFVELANTGAATGGFIAEFDQRLSGIAKSAGIGLGALSGLGAGLEEMGARVESSTTAVQKLIINISADVPKAAKVAGKSLEEFRNTLQIDPTEALLQYSQGLVKNKASFEEVVASFKDAGEEGARVIETISKLGTGADQLRTRIDLGKKSIEETGAITEAFTLKNENLGAEIDKLGKEFNRLMTSSAVIDFLKGAITGARDFIKWLKELPQTIKENRITIALLTLAFGLMNKQFIISNALWLARKAAMIAEIAYTKIAATVTSVYRIGLAAFAVVQALVTGNTVRLALAWGLLNKAFMSSGIGLIITAVITLGVALDSAFSKVSNLEKASLKFNKAAAEAYGDQVNRIEQIKKALENENVGYQQKKQLLAELIAINPEFVNTLKLDAQGHLYGAQAIGEYIKALKRKGEMQALQDLSNETQKELLKKQAEQDSKDSKGSPGFFSQLFDLTTPYKILGKEKADEKLKDLKETKKYFDDKLQKMYEEEPGTLSVIQPADTPNPFGKGATISKNVADRKKELDEKIKSLKDSYELLSATDKKGQSANLALQKKYQDELDALMGTTKKGPKSDNQKEYERLKKEAAAFQKDLLKLKSDAELDGKSIDEAEVKRIEKKYSDLLAKALSYYQKNLTSEKDFVEQKKLLSDLQMKEVGGVTAEKDYKQSLENSDRYFDEKRKQAAQDYANGITSEEEYNAALEQIAKDSFANRIIVHQNYVGYAKSAEAGLTAEQQKQYEADLSNFIKSEEQKRKEAEATEKLRKELSDAEKIAGAKLQISNSRPGSNAELEAKKNLLRLETEMKAKALQEQYKISEENWKAGNVLYDQLMKERLEGEAALDKEANLAKVDRIFNYVNQAADALNSLNTIISNRENKELARDRKANEEKKKNLKKQLDGKLLSQAQYQKKIDQLDEEQARKEKEARVRQAQREKALAIFQALINTAAAITKTFTEFGWPLGIPMAAAMAATGAFQIGAIASAPLPEAARGKWFREGDKHSDPSGGIHALIERNEAVIKADAMTDSREYTVTGTPAQITSKLNSMHGGVNWAAGASISMVPKFRERPPQLNPNLPRIMEQGGIVRPITGTTKKELDDDWKKQMLEVMERNVEASERKLKDIRAVVSLHEFKQQDERYNRAKRASGLG